MTRAYTSFDRAVALRRLEEERFDVLVIGGGITGAGVALDAASRGLSTALVEKSDFASGTSSKSSKMIHGGLRYLQQNEFGLVHENLVERHRLLRNAPHLVEPLPFLVPIFGKGGMVDKTIVRGFSAALWMYDIGGGWRIGKRHQRIPAAEIVAHLPTVDPERLVAGFVYHDARADDARLTLTVVRTAVLDHAAVAANYAEAVRLERSEDGRVIGAQIRTEQGDLRVSARVVVNAAGVWADRVRGLEEGHEPDQLTPAKGVHLAFPSSKLPCDMAALIPVRSDRRSIFMVPWGEHTYLGTTDTAYSGGLDDPRVEKEDVEYLLSAVNAVVKEPLDRSDIVGAWAGLRPLLARAPGQRHRPSVRTADLSRRHKVLVSAGGVVTITGGKLTTYRKMAEDTLDEVARVMHWSLGSSPTRRLLLRGSTGFELLLQSGAGSSYGLGDRSMRHLARRFGGETSAVLALASSDASLLDPLVPGLAYLRAEALYAVRYEMARSLSDVLSRRTRASLLDAKAAAGAAADVARLIAGELSWSRVRAEEEAELFRASLAHELEGVGVAT